MYDVGASIAAAIARISASFYEVSLSRSGSDLVYAWAVSAMVRSSALDWAWCRTCS
jgi:hypothetical protein